MLSRIHQSIILNLTRFLFGFDSGLLTGNKRTGVKFPERVRVHKVAKLPEPDNPILWQAANQVGFLDPNMVAMTLGYSINICHGHMNKKLMRHELQHVYQYENYGSIDTFPICILPHLKILPNIIVVAVN